MEVVPSFKYLGIHINNNLTWHTNSVSLIKKARQRLCFLRRLKQAGLGTSILTKCISADRTALHWVVTSAQRITVFFIDFYGNYVALVDIRLKIQFFCFCLHFLDLVKLMVKLNFSN